MKHLHCTRRDGFTLVELLVVIGIIALLIAILLPTLNSVRGAAAFANCQSNVRQLAVGTVQYSVDHQGWIPPGLRRDYWGGGTNKNGVTVPDGIRAYNRFESPQLDPSAFRNGARWSRDYLGERMTDRAFALNSTGWEGWLEVAYDSIFTCPYGADRPTGVARNNPWKAGYSMNGTIAVSARDFLAGATGQPATSPQNSNRLRGAFKKITRVEQSANAMLLVESENESEDGLRMLNDDVQNSFTFASLPHDGRNSIVFADGHAEAITFEELPDPNEPSDNGTWQIFWLGSAN